MTAGPLRRIIGILGLLALAPVALGLATGTLAVEDAAMRAVAVGTAVVLLGRLASVVLSSTVRRVEAGLSAAAEADEQLVG